MNNLLSIQKQLELIKPSLVSRYHVSELGLFGSVVRDDFSPESDIDIIVDFSRPIGIEFIDLADELEAQLKRKVDLVSKKGIKPQYFKAIQSDVIYV
jgi:predicted nucleotidyltransferase